MIEILAALETKEDYSKYIDIVYKHNTDNDITRILKTIDIYYSNNIGTEIEWTTFSTYFFVKNPMIKEEKKAIFDSIFTKLDKTSSTLKSELVSIFLERYHAERIAVLAMEVAEGKPKATLSNVEVELDTYTAESGGVKEMGAEENKKDLHELLTTVSHGSGLNWRLTALNESLGEIRKNDFIMFGGRPDSGKSTMLCSEGGYMAQQLEEGKRLLYFTNEEGGDDIKLRLITSVLGVTLSDLQSDPLTHWDSYVKIMGGDKDKIKVIDKYDLNTKDIEWWLSNEDVGLICIDQLRKVKGFYTTKGIERTEKIFNLAREWSKHYAPLLTVGQLDGQAENVAYPDMSRLYESKTAIQGELDAIINIGRVDGTTPPNLRYLNVVKNKLPTPGNPLLRNGRHEVILHKEIARFS